MVVVDGGETGIGGVTLDLYWDLNGNGVIDPGEPLVGSTVTASDGSYLFSGLPTDDGGGDAQFVAVVTDESGALNGYWHSLGTAGTDNNSQSDPYAVTLTPGEPNNTTADFGYYVQPASVGDYVWLDRDNDGIQDIDEPGIRGVKVTLTITYPNNDVVTVVTYTDRDGKYSFGNLLLDEDHRLADNTAGTPTYTISFETPPSTTPSPACDTDNPLCTPATDSNGTSTVVTTLVQGQTDLTYDSGFYTIRLDLGDLPDSLAGLPDYPTFFSPGPAHVIFPDTNGNNIPVTTPDGRIAVWLGTIVDVEPDGFPSGTASGDDSNGANDEDGLVLADSGWVAGESSTATIKLNSSAPTTVYFGLWIDWTGDGVFDAFYSGQGLTESPVDVFSNVYVPGDYKAGSNVYFRLRASDFSLAEEDYEGTIVNGEVEDYWYTFQSGGTPTPVTLSYFHAQRRGANVTFEWSTATETGNLGFNLYVVDANGQLQQINPELIFSEVVDSLEPQDYTFRAKTDGTVFYIEDVSVQGETVRHGPFTLGEAYGERVAVQKMDNAAIAREFAAQAAARQAELRKDFKLPSAALREPTVAAAQGPQLTNTVNIKVSQTGIQRVTYEALRAAGLDLNRVPVVKIAVMNRGQVVPVHVYTNPRAQLPVTTVRPRPGVPASVIFGPGSYIEFYGEALDTLYTGTNIYTVQVLNNASGKAARMPQVNKPVNNRIQPQSFFMDTLVVDNRKAYNYRSPSDTPWFDTRMSVGRSAGSWNFPFVVTNLASADAAQTLEVVLWGGTDFADISPDHHVLMSVNGIQVADVTFDGMVVHVVKAMVPAGVLRQGENTLTLTLPGDTDAPSDMVYLQKFSLSYPRTFRAEEGRLTFTAMGDVFTVTNLPSTDVLVYRLDESGPARLTRVRLKREGSAFSATFAGSKQPATYLVTTAAAANLPALEPTRLKVNLNQPADFLIISHPHFIEGLAPLVAARRAEGLTVNVMNVEDLYTQYSYGVFDPYAIQAHIRHAAANLGTRYVLLVGGDMRDYRNYTGVTTISYLPSLFAPTGHEITFASVDALYTDLSGDGLPDLPIGRFPVRTQAELEMLVNKTLAYGARTDSGMAVFVSDKYDPRGVSFKNISTDMQKRLPAGWQVQALHLDDLAASVARRQLLAALNNGASLVTFTGHSSHLRWTLGSSLFTLNDVSTLQNHGRPFVAVQYGCWTTFYTQTNGDYLLQKMLFSGENGAAAVFGSVAIASSDTQHRLGNHFTARLAQPGVRIGDAMQLAKAELARNNPGALDVLLGWTLMGDPTLIMLP
jgi:hypothetical protein